MPLYSLYLHIPFCRHRCAYCDFNTYAGLEAHIPAYLEALCREIELMGISAGERLPVHTIFFGGGTPSLIAYDQLKRILNMVKGYYDLQEGVEITLEANPGTLSPRYLQKIRSYGINRISLGMQSARSVELYALEREHDFIDVIQSVKWARAAGYDNINLDLIFGLPDQTLSQWQESLTRAADLQPDHLAIYSLILEAGTAMKSWVDRGLIIDPDPDVAAEMYEWTVDYLDRLGYVHYEISNWARHDTERDFTCRHNLQYWRLEPYLGFGAGAHGFVSGYHTENVASPIIYAKKMLAQEIIRTEFPGNPATVVIEHVDQRREMGELMLMGLRLTDEGISYQEFYNRFGVSIWEVYGSQIERLMDWGLLEDVEQSGERIRLTSRGQLLGNRVFIEFIE